MTLEMTRFSFTVADYDRLITAGILDEDDRVELIEGEIVEMTPIGLPHASSVDRLNMLFVELFGREVQVSVQNPIQLGDASEPQPDLSVLHRRTDFYRSVRPTSSDVYLLVEVADSSVAFDRQIKIPLYARYGVVEVWLIDVNDDTITVYRDPTPTGYSTVLVVERGATLVAQAFPGREIAVDDILG